MTFEFLSKDAEVKFRSFIFDGTRKGDEGLALWRWRVRQRDAKCRLIRNAEPGTPSLDAPIELTRHIVIEFVIMYLRFEITVCTALRTSRYGDDDMDDAGEIENE